MELTLELTLLDTGVLLTEEVMEEDTLLLSSVLELEEDILLLSAALELEDVMMVVILFLKVIVVQPFAGTLTMPSTGVTSCIIQLFCAVSVTLCAPAET